MQGDRGMRILTRLSDLSEVSDLDHLTQRRVWRRAVVMALARPWLPALTISTIALAIAVARQAERFERVLFIPLFLAFVLVGAIIFNEAMVRTVRPYLRAARQRELSK